jgi:3'(2'),5'-bisphosphate nucleotidase
MSDLPDRQLLSEPELRVLCDIAVGAGKEIMSVYRDGGEVWTKADDSPVTEADLRADRLIRRELQARFPGTLIVSEESSPDPQQGFEGGAMFLVDPLDGTKEFLSRTGEFTVNIAWVSGGRPMAGVVLAPARDELFFALAGVGAWKTDASGTRPIRPEASPGPLRVIGSRSHGGELLQAWLRDLQVPHTFVAAGSSLKFCRIAEGEADIYPRFGPTSQWDTAAGQAILEAAGGVVLAEGGGPLRYGPQEPILNPHFYAAANRRLCEHWPS